VSECFDHVGLSVADLDAASRFYADAFEHRQGRDGIQGATPIEALATRGYGHFALASADIESAFTAALAAGATAILPPGESPEPGVLFAFLADPEGNLIELVQRAETAGEVSR
jgi:catechol 2,3-dioxygenase-like lactoylglutathione lyase family enzyme